MAARRPENDTAGSRAGPEGKSGPREVRAGPGDAGRQDRPETLPSQPGDRRRGRQATTLLAALVVVGLIVWAALSLVA